MKEWKVVTPVGKGNAGEGNWGLVFLKSCRTSLLFVGTVKKEKEIPYKGVMWELT